jgi:hypothetical protein
MFMYTDTIITESLVSDTNYCFKYRVNPINDKYVLHPLSCPHTFNSSKPSQSLNPPSFPHAVNSRKPSQPLYPLSCPHTTQQAHTISDPLSPCTFTNLQFTWPPTSLSVANTTLTKRSSISDSRQANRMYKQISSVLFKPCSWPSKSAHQTENGCYQRTTISYNFFNAINNTHVCFRSIKFVITTEIIPSNSLCTFSLSNNSINIFTPSFF